MNWSNNLIGHSPIKRNVQPFRAMIYPFKNRKHKKEYKVNDKFKSLNTLNQS